MDKKWAAKTVQLYFAHCLKTTKISHLLKYLNFRAQKHVDSNVVKMRLLKLFSNTVSSLDQYIRTKVLFSSIQEEAFSP